MKKNEHYEIDHITETIILSKKFKKAASILNTAEYKELMKIRNTHPSYKLVERVIKKADSKCTYHSLTIEEMKKFISFIHEKDEETMKARLNEFNELEKFYDQFHASAKYGALKKWFLNYYKEDYTKQKRKEAA